MSATFAKVMLTLDGSGFSRQAAPQAAAIAERFGSVLVLYSVLKDTRHAMTLPLLESDIDTLEAGAARRLRAEAEKKVEKLRQDAEAIGVTPDKVEIVIEAHNNPAEAIVHFAKESGVDLIVMCTHGRSGLDRSLHGSVAEVVVRHAPCPVMLVRARET